MMAITTSSSMSVKPRLGRGENLDAMPHSRCRRVEGRCEDTKF
jgi:hypothetical protein